MDKKALIRRVNTLARNAEKGEVINLLYNGEKVAQYECDYQYEPDAKSPDEWVRGVICFDIELKGKSVENVTLQKVEH